LNLIFCSIHLNYTIITHQPIREAPRFSVGSDPSGEKSFGGVHDTHGDFDSMTKKEMNLKVFRGEKIPHVFFQPRFEPWFEWHKKFDTLPSEFRDKTIRDLFDDLDVSMRYIHYYSGVPDPVNVRYSEKIKIREKREGDKLHRIITTPRGDLVETQQLTIDKTWRTVDFAVKNQEDLKKLIALCENTTHYFKREHFEHGVSYMGDRGEPQFWLPKSPYQALCQIWMKTEDFIYALADAPDLVGKAMESIDNSHDVLYEEIVGYGGINIINFGENLHAQLFSPAYFEKYFIPYYEKRSNQLREAGIFTHIHIDGFFKPLLPYLCDLPFDGYEALTPVPQGDVSLEEIKEHIGDKVLLDGIPAIFFLPHHPVEELQRCVEEIVALFSPRLILGISDELPEGTDKQGVERMEWVSKFSKSTRTTE
jgi:hypothetical protein